MFLQTRRKLDSEFKAIAQRLSIRDLSFMDEEDIYNWLLFELWQACRTYDARRGDSNLTLMKYWWACWRNRKAKLIKQTYSHRYRFNAEAIMLDEDAGTGSHDVHIPPCPVKGYLEGLIWRMLGQDMTVDEILWDLDIDMEVFDSVLASFRNAAVHAYLIDGGM